MRHVLGMILAAAVAVSAPLSGFAAELKPVTVATVAFNEAEVNNPVAIRMMKERGFDLRVIRLDQATTMNEVAENGEIQASLHQHKPWMDAYNKGKNKTMVMLEPYVHYNVFGMYSMKYKRVEDIPDGARIVIPEDVSNQVRALRLLEQIGFVTLAKDVEVPTIFDIKENRKDLQFSKVHVHQVMKTLPDVDAVLSAKMFQVSNKVDPKTEISVSKDLGDFGVGFVTTAANKDADWAKALTEVFTSKEMKAEILRIFQGSYVPGPV